jgi:hypothetical protein
MPTKKKFDAVAESRHWKEAVARKILVRQKSGGKILQPEAAGGVGISL